MNMFRDIQPTRKITPAQSSTHARVKKNQNTLNKKRHQPENKKKPDDDHKVDEFI